MSKQSQTRDEPTGRYSFDGDHSRLCVCGHSLGVHSAESPHDCLLYSFTEGSSERKAEAPLNECRCAKFKLPRKAKLLVFGCRYYPRMLGHNQSARIIVATTSIKKAAELCGVTYHEMKKFGTETRNDEECAIALASPGVAFVALRGKVFVELQTLLAASTRKQLVKLVGREFVE